MGNDANNQRTGTSDVQNSLTTRYAEERDLADVLEMYMQALSEIRTFVEEPDLERCADTVLESYALAPTVLIEKAGKLIGFAGLRTFKPLHSTVNCLTEYMFYIAPAFRSIRAAKTLSDAVQAVSSKFKLPLYMSHMVFDVPLAVKEKFLKRWGYKVQSMQVYYGGA